MNLSCSGESGCLFFKVIGITNVTSGWLCVTYLTHSSILPHMPHIQSIAKFNSSVPGTVYGEENLATTLSTDSVAVSSFNSTSASKTHTSPMSVETSNTAVSPSEASGPDLFIHIIVTATGVVALLFVVVLLCMILVYCCSTDKKKRNQR